MQQHTIQLKVDFLCKGQNPRCSAMTVVKTHFIKDYSKLKPNRKLSNPSSSEQSEKKISPNHTRTQDGMLCKRHQNDPNYPKSNSINEIEEGTHMTETDNDSTSICTDLSDLDLSSDNSDLWPKDPHTDITQNHISNRWTADFRMVINDREIFTIWHTGTCKSVISQSSLEKLHTAISV